MRQNKYCGSFISKYFYKSQHIPQGTKTLRDAIKTFLQTGRSQIKEHIQSILTLGINILISYQRVKELDISTSVKLDNSLCYFNFF